MPGRAIPTPACQPTDNLIMRRPNQLLTLLLLMFSLVIPLPRSAAADDLLSVYELALQADPELAGFALRNKVALLSPTNFLATVRTVGSVWSVHKQNTNAQEIAGRAGLLYDKFAGFVENLQQVGSRLQQAQASYDSAFSQLSTGSGNLLRQTDQLRQLGARNTKQIERELLEQSNEDGSLDGDAAVLPGPDS